MSDRADNRHGIVLETGVVRIVNETHLDIPANLRSDAYSAATQGLAAFDGWISTCTAIEQPVRAWHASRPQNLREDRRQVMLSIGPTP